MWKVALATLLTITGVAAASAQISTYSLKSNDRFGGRRVQASAEPNSAVIRIARPVSNAVIENITVDGAYRVIENAGNGATADHLVIRNVHATNLRRGLLRIRNDSSGVIEDVSATFSPQPQVPPNLPAGMQFEGTAHDWTIRNVTLSGFQMEMPPDRYWNGDGFSAERDTHDFKLINVTSNDNTDGGFDIKGTNFYLDNVSASGNARNFRFWSSIRIGTMTVGDTIRRGGTNGQAGIHIAGNAADPPVISIDRLIVRMTKPTKIIVIEKGPADLRIGSCDIQAPPGSRFIVAGKGGNRNLGPGCTFRYRPAPGDADAG